MRGAGGVRTVGPEAVEGASGGFAGAGMEGEGVRGAGGVRTVGPETVEGADGGFAGAGGVGRTTGPEAAIPGRLRMVSKIPGRVALRPEVMGTVWVSPEAGLRRPKVSSMTPSSNCTVFTRSYFLGGWPSMVRVTSCAPASKLRMML